MRTTIEISEEHRAQLLQLAARRGEKGFSKLVREALETYLDAHSRADDKRRRALLLRGSLGEGGAKQLRERTADIRGSWR
jgi:metal-responsive CopG/Arc/MetJ family transcriptional regulator